MDFKFTKSELIAKSVLEQCGLDDPIELPISDIILGRKAFYEEKPLDGKQGKIVSVGGRSIITINSNIEFEAKKRFTAAHELGHFEMHRDLFPIITDTEFDLLNWYQGGPQEMEANEFAAEFLMPSEIFYNECKSRRFGPDVVEHLSNRFGVSKTAAILKFVKRGNYPCAIIYCKENKMKWWKASSDFRNFLEFEHDKNPPTDSVAYELFTTNKIYKGDERKQDIWKSTWLKMRNDDEEDKRFYEYCLYVKSYNYSISIIWED